VRSPGEGDEFFDFIDGAGSQPETPILSPMRRPFPAELGDDSIESDFQVVQDPEYGPEDECGIPRNRGVYSARSCR